MRLVSGLRALGVVLAVAVAAFLVPMAYATLNEDDGPAPNIGAAFVILNQAHLRAPTQIDAFIPTRSASQKCLVTLAESDIGGAGQTVYCNARNFNGVNGIRLVVFLPVDAPSAFVVALTVYQQGARRYGPPVLYTGS